MHSYFEVDLETIWTIVERDLASLENTIRIRRAGPEICVITSSTQFENSRYGACGSIAISLRMAVRKTSLP